MKKKYVLPALIISSFILFHNYSPLTARSSQTEPAQRLKWYQQHVDMKEKSLFKNLPWQFIGPTNISGRMTDVAVVAPKGENYTIYAASASGGVWKTVNEGTTWEPVFQHAASTSIGDVTIAPSNQDIVWIGGGEANIFRSSMAGSGVYKSVNGGKTWEHMGLAGTHTIPRIVIHPRNPDIVYVASSGHEWTNNEERGVYKTTDGGENWEKILYIDQKTGVIDLVMDPTDSNILYAATWQRIRKKWNDPRNEPDYTGSSIYKTTNGGENWEEIVNSLPEARYRGRIGIDLCKSKPQVMYAFIDNYQTVGDWDTDTTDSYGRPMGKMIKGATVYRSDNGGESWRQVSKENDYMRTLCATYGWVFGQIRVDPVDENKIYVMGLRLNLSEDGGKTFRDLPGMHGDHHGLWIDPANTDYLVNCNDGGLSISYDGGKNWRNFTHNLPAVQFFDAAYDMDTPFHVYGSIQDHGSRRAAVDLSQGRNFIPAVEWEYAPGGEGSDHAIDPTNPDIVYSAGFYGSLTRTNVKTGETNSIVPKAEKGEPKLRGQWLAPFIISPHNPRIIYHGMNCLFRSLNMGEDWEKISPDLTYNDPEKIGDISYQTIFTISESPFKFGLIYVGTDDGRAHVTKDGGRHWTEISKNLPEKWISRIVASKYHKSTVYCAQNGKRDDDFAAYLWKSTDYGKTWKDISNNIPCGPINVIREDPKTENILYAGTDLGVYVSIDGGNTWNTLHQNFPTSFVHDLVIHPREDLLIAATHGRGMYVVDVRHIQKLNKETLKEDLYVLNITEGKVPASRWWGRLIPVYIDFYLKGKTTVSITIKKDNKEKINEFKFSGDKGYNRFNWDLKTGSQKTDKKPEIVEPGTYSFILKAGSAVQEGKITVKTN